MLYFLVGPSGAFTSWCEGVIVALMRQQGANPDVIRAGSVGEMALGLLQSRGPALVTLNQTPSALYSAMRDSGRQFIVANDDPLGSLFQKVQANGGDLADAVRAVTSGIANLPHYMSLPGALVLQRPADGHGAGAIAGHLGLDGPQAAVPVPPADPAGDPLRWWRALSAGDQAMVRGALGPILDPRSVSAFNWVPGLFWREGQPSEAVRGPVDITGRARCLLEGPAIVLPLGRWRLSLCLDFSEMATCNAFQVEVSAGAVLGSQILYPREAGEAEVHFDFAIGETAGGPLSIRLLLQRAAFDGTVDLVSARVTPGP